MVDTIPPLHRITFNKTHRLIPAHYPPIDLFEDIADPVLWEMIMSAESKVNPRVRDEVGDLRLVPVERRVSGPGASWVMAAFTHVSPRRTSRFSDGTYGVYYAGDLIDVALAETIFHFERRMRSTDESAMVTNYRELVASIDAELHDIRGDKQFDFCLEPDPDHWVSPQEFAKTLRNEHASDGIVYPSVRYPDGSAIAVFWPDVIERPTQGRHVAYHWNGGRVDRYFVYGGEDWITL